MNGVFAASITFAFAGILAFIAGSSWRAQRNAESGDFGPVVVGLTLLVVCELIAIILAVIGFVVTSI
jgi:hypothetical protein